MNVIEYLSSIKSINPMASYIEMKRPQTPPKPGYKWKLGHGNNWYQVKEWPSTNNKTADVAEVKNIIQHYEEQDSKTACQDAVRDIAKTLINSRISKDRIKVIGVIAPNKIRGGKTSHVFLQIDVGNNKVIYIDPTAKKQMGLNHGTYFSKLPDYYENPKEQPLNVYIN